MTKLDSKEIVTKFISEINFVNSAKQGDVIEIGLAFTSIGRTSITFSCMVRNVFTKKTIISIEKLVFVKIDNNGKPMPHSKTIDNLGFNTTTV